MAFKLTTSDKHFALSKTGDIPSWLKDELDRFNVNHQFEEEGFFERINRDDSPINILMGSRAFYEGWDSNRPNIINFINIGMGTDARKFILQSVGRGIRIEPILNKRRRLLELYNSKEIHDELFSKIKDNVLPLETLCIFGTNRAKGIKHTDYMHKLDGYKMIFEENESKPRKFEFKDLMGRVYTFLRADDINRLPQDGYRKYWFDNLDKVLTNILEAQQI